jgi:hypothetical protein
MAFMAIGPTVLTYFGDEIIVAMFRPLRGAKGRDRETILQLDFSRTSAFSMFRTR